MLGGDDTRTVGKIGRPAQSPSCAGRGQAGLGAFLDEAALKLR